MTQITPDETLLGLLAARTQHGYDLLESFRDPGQLGEVWRLSTSQIYAVLKRLEMQGLTKGREVLVLDAPKRMEYALTAAGRERLQAWLGDPCPSPSVHRVRIEFMSRLYIARLLNIPTTQIVENQKAACRSKRAELADRLETAQPGVGRLTLELVIAQLEVILQWLDRCELSPYSADER